MITNDVARLYETILSAPGMSETVKVDIRISRKNILLLHRVIERGLADKEGGKEDNPLAFLSAESKQELADLAADFLGKAGLNELNEKLKSFKG